MWSSFTKSLVDLVISYMFKMSKRFLVKTFSTSMMISLWQIKFAFPTGGPKKMAGRFIQKELLNIQTNHALKTVYRLNFLMVYVIKNATR